MGKRARVMLRVTVGVHAGGHEFISTAHEDQKFGVSLLPAGADASKLDVLDDLTDVTPAAPTRVLPIIRGAAKRSQTRNASCSTTSNTRTT